MKILHLIAYVYHRLLRRFNRRNGRWQTVAFEKHHKAMRYHKSFLLLLTICLIWSFGSVQADFLTEEEQTIYASDKVVKATVKIEPEFLEHGTGFFISSDTILTNEHVIRNSNGSVSIKSINGKICNGTVGYREEKVDLALIKTDCHSNDVLTFGDDVKIGRSIIAVGNPRDLDFTVSKGIVSAFRGGWIQSDAKIDFGSSGGVLANLYGEVVGVIIAKSKFDPYISFSIKSEEAKKFIERSK